MLGVDAYPVIVEADVASGLPSFSTVGLPQGAVKEGRERVISAVQNSGYLIPPKRITINLAPADATKENTPCSVPNPLLRDLRLTHLPGSVPVEPVRGADV